jgi:hypothetical protein
MRLLLVAASVLVLLIGTPLFLVPTSSTTFFSWTVNPPLTAAFLGAGYLGAFLLEFLSSREPIWARARVAVPSVFVFTIVMLWVTLVHLDKFHLRSDASVFTQGVAWAWLVIYAVVPVIMVVLTFMQLRAPGVDPPRLAPLPRSMRLVLVVQSAALLLLGLGLLASPVSVAADVWPWGLSALTARAIGAFLLGTGVVAAHSVWENDFVRLRGAMAAYCAFGFLEVFVVVRFAAANHPKTGAPVLDWSDPRIWIYVLFFLSLGAIGLWGWLEVRKAQRPDVANSGYGTG